ncbi:MAG: precorrin-3B C(17)-methyltransferase, partial [Chloroflexi bacterium]|nr:precorrin-3B C(17)-methyltransferase [Chloroflexota bacterium]
SGQTPVGIVRDAFRPGQSVTITDLEHLVDHAEAIDMVTTVLVGNSTTYLHQGHMATPRGYEEKIAGQAQDPTHLPPAAP